MFECQYRWSNHRLNGSMAYIKMKKRIKIKLKRKEKKKTRKNKNIREPNVKLMTMAITSTNPNNSMVLYPVFDIEVVWRSISMDYKIELFWIAASASASPAEDEEWRKADEKNKINKGSTDKHNENGEILVFWRVEKAKSKSKSKPGQTHWHWHEMYNIVYIYKI